MLTLTESAQKAVQNFMTQADKPVTGLRITVDSGGCSGFTYGMKLEEAANDDDTVLEFENEGLTKVYVDPTSAEMLEGVTVDFVESLEGAGFKFENPKAEAQCGCGKSFC